MFAACCIYVFFFFFQAEDGIRDLTVTGVQTCALPIWILDHVGWHGAAMVEFKVRADGRPYLMEINPRFWGSLQLAIDAGVDFPWLAYQLAAGLTPDSVEGYRIGVRNRWLLGDLDHVYLSWKESRGLNATCRAIVG